MADAAIRGLVYMVPDGIVWPYPLAIALSWIGNMGASYVAFAFARWFGKDWVQVRIPKGMHKYDARLERGGVWVVILLRLVVGQLPPADWLPPARHRCTCCARGRPLGVGTSKVEGCGCYCG